MNRGGLRRRAQPAISEEETQNAEEFSAEGEESPVEDESAPAVDEPAQDPMSSKSDDIGNWGYTPWKGIPMWTHKRTKETSFNRRLVHTRRREK